jgi:hypothetical protein
MSCFFNLVVQEFPFFYTEFQPIMALYLFDKEQLCLKYNKISIASQGKTSRDQAEDAR